MRFFTSLLSTVFGVLLLGLLVYLGLEYLGQNNWYFLLPLVAVLILITFTILDRTYRRIHPAMYQTVWGTKEAGPSFNLLQSLVSALRSAVLCVTIPAVVMGLLFLVVAPAAWLAVKSDIDSFNPLLLIIVLILMLGVLGSLMQWFYQRSALGLMLEKSGFGASGRRSRKKSRTRGVKLSFRILDDKKGISPSKKVLEKQRLAKGVQRLIWLRAMGPPLATVVGVWGIAKLLGVKLESNLLLAWVALFLLAWLGSSLRLVDRSPLRQLRLGGGWLLHAVLVAVCWPILLIYELPGRGGRPSQQWQVLPWLGQLIGNLLRSPRLLWIPAILFLVALPFGTDENSIEKFFLLLAAAILLFELTYRLFNRLIRGRQKGSNRLVFLRVFGERRRGRFLFQHIVPRWAGMGSIICIAAPDVSVHQMEPDIGFDLLLGRLRQRFLSHDEAGVIGRHLNADVPGAVWEDHCFDDSWMPAVQSLMTQNAIVLMDLRGFGPQRKGCIYELGMLRDDIPIENVVFLTDASTDFDFLKTTLIELWKSTSAESPNQSPGGAKASKRSKITIFRMSSASAKSAKQLTQLLIEACVSNEGYHQKNGKALLDQLIDDMQLLAADAEVQIKAVGGRQPGKKVLDAGWSSDHDLGFGNYLTSWKVVTEAQHEAIYAVDNAVQEIRVGAGRKSAVGLREDPAWEEVRLAARACLKALGKRRSAPKPGSRK